MSYKGRIEVTAPVLEPVTLAQAKEHLREDGDAQDAVINGMIPAARRLVEARSWRALITQTWDFTFRRFPTGREMYVPMSPVSSITSVTYRDTDNATQTLSSANYLTDFSEEPAVIRLLEGQTWPDTYFNRPSAVVIRAVVGYGAATTDVPENFIQAMNLAIGHWYSHRDSVIVGEISKKIEEGIDTLIDIDHIRPMVA